MCVCASVCVKKNKVSKNKTINVTKKQTSDMRLTVVLDILRHIVVDDVLNIWEVQSLGCDICRYEYVLLAAGELLNRDRPLILI